MTRMRFRSVASAVMVLTALTMGLTGCEEKTSLFFSPSQISDDTPPPQDGNIMGQVTLDGEPESGVTVTLDGSTTTMTDSEGMYTFDPVSPGQHTVAVTPPEGAECEPESQTVDVPEGDKATADFSCTSETSDFSVTLDPDYRHDNGTSVVCGKISTDPPQAGASFEVTVSGPGVIDDDPETGMLDDMGMGTFEEGIDQFGDYEVTVEVTSNGSSSTAMGTVSVSGAQSSCPS